MCKAPPAARFEDVAGPGEGDRRSDRSGTMIREDSLVFMIALTMLVLTGAIVIV
jgi:hypothetical protein